MYQIKYDNYGIYDPRDTSLLLRSATCHLQVDEPGNLVFQIDADHPSYSVLVPLKGIMEVSEDGVTLFKGRIIRRSLQFDKSLEVEAEGALAFLNDSIIKPFSFPHDFLDDPAYQTAAESGNVVQYFLNWIITQHNSQVSAFQQLTLGTVTVADANNYISRASSEYSSAWQVIKDKLFESSLGGHILVRYEANGTYIDYVSSYATTNAQTVEFGENLVDLLREIDSTEKYTVIEPRGKNGLDISSLPDGAIDSDLVKSGTQIYSTSGIAAYGKITHYEEWGDVEVATNLKNKAASRLATNGHTQSISVTAHDLHKTNGSIQSFRVGRNTLLKSTPHGINLNYPLTAMDIDICEPAKTQITFGDSENTQSAQFDENITKINEDLDGKQIQIDTNTKETTNILTRCTEMVTEAIQTSQAIIFQALESYVETSDLEAYKQVVSTQFTQTASSITMAFNTATTQITNVNNDLQTKYNERASFIRFEDGNIILGKQGNLLTLTLQNDRIKFMQNGAEVAYFTNNKLYVTDGEFMQRLICGTFGFIPGASGNLSFKKVTN